MSDLKCFFEKRNKYTEEMIEMAKKYTGSSDRQINNKANELFAIKDLVERNAKLALLDIVKPDQAIKIREIIANLQAKEEGKEKPAEVVVEKTTTVAISEVVAEPPLETQPAITETSRVVQPVTEVRKQEESTTVTDEAPKDGKATEKILWVGPGETEKTKKERKIKTGNRKRLQSDVRHVDEKPGKAFVTTLEAISNNANGSGHVNAIYSGKKGIEMSISTHAPFVHRTFGSIIPVIIQTSTVPNRRQPSRKLKEKDVGSWVRQNVNGWENGIWMIRIGHTNILSNSPLNVNKDIVGLAMISSKKVEQKGRETQFFHHIIILGLNEDIKPAFSLVINNDIGSTEITGAVHIGPTVGAKRDNRDVEEYLHLEPLQ